MELDHSHNFEDWKKEVSSALEEHEKRYIRRGRKVITRYEDERDGTEEMDRRYNIFTTNVEIMQSALYAQIPKVEVKRRFDDTHDQTALVAANIIKRMIDIDLACQDNDFDLTMQAAIFDRLVPGIGAAWLRFAPEFETVEILDPFTGQTTQQQQVIDYAVEIDHVIWEDFIYSPCRTWPECRWVGRRVYMDRAALVKRFGEEMGNEIPLDYSTGRERDGDNRTGPTNKTEKNQAKIYEIWDKVSKQVIWLSMGFSRLLDVRADPLKLENFWPTPKPLLARTTTTRFSPISDYYVLQDQYRELDTVYNRISLLVSACKVAGVYDRASGAVSGMLNGNENKLIPVDNWAIFAEKGGLKGVIDWFPLDIVVATLQQLQAREESLKQKIYELSGISDIMRGSTNPYESAAGQQVKAQFASARIQKVQNEIARFAGDILSLKAEIMLKHFPAEFMVKKSNVEQTDMAQLAQPAMQLLCNAENFEWRVQILPDTMAQIDYLQEKQQRNDLISAAAGFLNNALPAMQNNPAIAPFMVSLLKFGIAGYKNTQGLEVVLDQAVDGMMQQMQQAAANPQPNPEMQKMQMQLQQSQQQAHLEMQKQTQKHQQDMETQLQQNQIALQHMQANHQQEMQQTAERHQLQLELEREKASQAASIKGMEARLDAIVKLFSMKADENGKTELRSGSSDA